LDLTAWQIGEIALPRKRLRAKDFRILAVLSRNFFVSQPFDNSHAGGMRER
jgi:hypothetical protein